MVEIDASSSNILDNTETSDQTITASSSVSSDELYIPTIIHKVF